MRTTHRVLTTAVLALGLSPLTAVPAGAASETHITGVFTAPITSVGCLSTDPSTGAALTDPATWGPASGTWRVNVGTSTASARFVIYLKEVPHVAYTLPLKVTTNDGTTVTAVATTPAGDLTVTISGGTMSYRIAPYDSRSFGGDTHSAYCPSGSVTYHGTVS